MHPRINKRRQTRVRHTCNSSHRSHPARYPIAHTHTRHQVDMFTQPSDLRGLRTYIAIYKHTYFNYYRWSFDLPHLIASSAGVCRPASCTLDPQSCLRPAPMHTNYAPQVAPDQSAGLKRDAGRCAVAALGRHLNAHVRRVHLQRGGNQGRWVCRTFCGTSATCL